MTIPKKQVEKELKHYVLVKCDSSTCSSAFFGSKCRNIESLWHHVSSTMGDATFIIPQRLRPASIQCGKVNIQPTRPGKHTKSY